MISDEVSRCKEKLLIKINYFIILLCKITTWKTFSKRFDAFCLINKILITQPLLQVFVSEYQQNYEKTLKIWEMLYWSNGLFSSAITAITQKSCFFFYKKMGYLAWKCSRPDREVVLSTLETRSPESMVDDAL